jgi:hypothetical protein
MRELLWVLTILGSLIGGGFLVAALDGDNSAPQQAAGAGIAIAFGVLPYVCARAVDEMRRK